MDYTKFRNEAGSRNAGKETVAVNHRALITRTLTKYPVDYALYRELLQNSADARASKVVISFTTDKSGVGLSKENISSIHNRDVVRLTVKNNGQLFENDDWNRLKEIAKGNPNESKIGAFGVGFYSVFELTDEPLVHSGDTVMSFFYQEDQLCYRKEKVEGESVSKNWTVVDLPYRGVGRLPNLPSFTAFLTQSFMLIPLLEVILEVDGIELLNLNKVLSPSIRLEIPNHVNRKSPNGFLCLNELEEEFFQVKVKYMNVTQVEGISNDSSISSKFFSFSKNIISSLVTSSSIPSDNTEVVCFLRKVTGIIDVSISSSFALKMKETVMKAPAKKAIVSMLTYNQEERELSELKPPLSDYIFPKDFNDAKIYIGFPTKQSTSIRSHICMNQLIPTMERTAVDMSNNYVKDWNKQMLYISGVLARVIYENEMNKIKSRYKGLEEVEGGKEAEGVARNTRGSTPSGKTIDNLLSASCYIINRFEFNKSTPDPTVGNWITGGFWNCSKKLSLPSQKGIKLSNEIRIADSTTACFIKNIPLLPQDVINECPKFIDRADELGFLKKISIDDIKEEIQKTTLTLDEFKNLIDWLSTQLNSKKFTLEQVNSILSITIVTKDTTSIFLKGINCYQNKFTIEEGQPLPPNCIPFSFIKDIRWSTMESLGWHELDYVEWLNYLVTNVTTLPLENNISLDPLFSTSVLQKISNNWSSFLPPAQTTIINLLKNQTCIPTQLGMKLPSESYLNDIPLFPNLPVKSPQLTANYKFLFTLGLRESVDMAFVLKLLHNPDNSIIKWSTFDMVKYLTDNRKSLKKSDWQLLKEKAFFEADEGKEEQATKTLYKACELYAPDTSLCSLQFKTLKWDYWLESSPEATLLFDIGLLRYPNEAELFSKTTNEKNINLAIDYYLKNYTKYSPHKVSLLPNQFIPCKLNDALVYKSPSECFTEKEVELFGFPIVRSEQLISEGWKFGINKSPTMTLLINSIVNKKVTITLTTAPLIFTYLSTKISQLSQSHIRELQNSLFIPITQTKYQYPLRSFLESSEEEDIFFKDFFDFITMPSSAIPFLLKIGVRYKPNIIEIAQVAVDDPLAMYQLASSDVKYEAFLSHLADSWSKISTNYGLVSKMKSSKFLLALSYSGSYQDDDEFNYNEKISYSLSSAPEIVIVDDVISFNLFKSYLKVAPQDSKLEAFYHLLGASRLSSIVEYRAHLGSQLNLSDPTIENKAIEIKKRIIERVKLFFEGTREKTKLRLNSIKSIEVIPVSKIQIQRSIKSRYIHSPKITENKKAYMESLKLYVDLVDFDWYDVSHVLIEQILEKPTPDSVIVLESQLRSDLRSLQRKGYNVDRLLKQKEQEDAKILQERERVREEARKKLERKKDIEVMSVSSPTSPQVPSPIQSQKPLAQQDPPPYTQSDAQSQSPHLQQHSRSTQPPPPPPPPPQQHQQHPHPPQNQTLQSLYNGFRSKIKNYTDNQNNNTNTYPSTSTNSTSRPTETLVQPKRNTEPINILQKGLNSSRPFNQNSLQANNKDIDIPPPVELMSCNTNTARNLRFVTELSQGLRCFVQSNVPDFNEIQLKEAERFQQILFACSTIYQIDRKSFHLYLEPNSTTIAFNLNGSLFFNIHYFWSPFKNQPREIGGTWNPTESLNYWYPIVAHELAHNLATSHGSHHSFYTEAYIQYYMEQFKTISKQLI